MNNSVPSEHGSSSTGGVSKPIREVPAFTMQANQKNTVVVKYKPPNPHPKPLHSRKSPISSVFRSYYGRADFPLKIEHAANGKKTAWRIPVEKLDYSHVLPIFCDGLIETAHPYAFLAEQGLHDLLDIDDENRILAHLPEAIPRLKNVLDTKDPNKVGATVKILRKLILNTEHGAVALMPYFRQILPIFGYFKDKNINIGDCVDYGQRKKTNLSDLIGEILELLEKRAGRNAYINIKYVIPTYESCIGSH